MSYPVMLVPPASSETYCATARRHVLSSRSAAMRSRTCSNGSVWPVTLRSRRTTCTPNGVRTGSAHIWPGSSASSAASTICGPRLDRDADCAGTLQRQLADDQRTWLPEIDGDKPVKKALKVYPIGFFHIAIAEVQTAEGKLYLFVAIDRTSKFAFTELHTKATTRTAADFLRALIKAVPYRIHTVLTDNGIHFTDPKGETWTPAEIRQMIVRKETFRAHAFEYACALTDIDHRLTRPKHLWTNGQVERMNRKKINISTVVAGQLVGLNEVDDGIWLVSFMHHGLGYIDLEQRALQPIDNPLGTRLSPMSWERSVTYLSRMNTGVGWRATTDDDEHYVYAIAL